MIQAAFGTYLLSAVYGTFPKEVLEAASIDGATRWQILWRVIFPISRPTLSVLLIFFFIWTWNEFLIPLTFLVSNENQTVPVAISVLQGDRLMDVTTTSASALLGLIPTLLFFLIFLLLFFFLTLLLLLLVIIRRRTTTVVLLLFLQHFLSLS